MKVHFFKKLNHGEYVPNVIAFTNSLMRSVFDAIPSPLYFKDRSGVFLGCNDAYERFMGVSREKIVGSTIEDIAPTALASQVNDLDRKLINDGGSQVYEASILLPDGREANILEKKSIFTGPDGKIIGFVGEITDISMLKDTEKALEESEDRFYHLMEVADEGVFIHQNGTFLELNSKLAIMLGLEHKEQLAGRSILEFVSPKSVAEVREKISASDNSSYQLDVLAADGTTFRASMRSRNFEHSGQEVRLTVIRNLTDCCNASNGAALDWLKK